MKQLLPLFAVAVLASTGCASYKDGTNAMVGEQINTLSRVQTLRNATPEATKEKVIEPKESRQKIDAAWVTNTTTALAINKRPPAFDTPIQLTSSKQLTVSEVASRIQALTGMQINISSDVYRGPQMPAIVGFDGTVEDLLNRIASFNRLTYKVENGAVNLFRYETAVLRVKRKPGRLTTSTQIGVSGSSSGTSSGSTSGGDMSASIIGGSNFDPWVDLGAKVKSVLTPEGKYQVAEASSTIVITDVPEAVELARKIVEDDNKLATSAITVKVEVINVTNDDDQNLGVNWNMVFNELENAIPTGALTLSSPGTLATGSVGSFKINIPTGSTSRFANSDFLIQALNKVGKAQTLLRRDFTTIHNVPSGFSRTNSKSYRAKTTAAPASSTGGGGQVGVEPGQVVTGTRFIVTPSYLGEGEYAIELAYNDSFLRELVSLGAGQQVIDAPDVDGNQMYNVTTLKIGETTILNAFEIDTSKAADQGLTANTTSAMMTAKNKTRIYMLVTVTGGPQ